MDLGFVKSDHWPNMRRHSPITSRIPARMMKMLLHPQPAQGP